MASPLRKKKIPYDPHPAQKRFHDARWSYRNRLFLAGVGSGKTMAGVFEVWAMAAANPGWDGAIVSPTYPMLRDVILPIWKQWIPAHLYTYYKKDNLFELCTGQRIFLRSADSADSLRGLNIGFAWLDEFAILSSSEQYKEIQRRIRHKAIPLPGIFITTTPKGYNWMARMFIDAMLEEDPEKVYESTQRGGRRRKLYGIIRCASNENPHFSEDLFRQLWDEYTPEERDRELLGKFTSSSGLCWPINSTHTSFFAGASPYRNILNLKVTRTVAGVDWGFSAPFSIVVARQVKDGRWFIIDEFYRRGMLIDDCYAKMKELRSLHNIKTFYCDSAEPERIKTAINKHLLPCQAAKKGANSIAKGIKEFRQLLSFSSRWDDVGVHIDPYRCPNLIKEAKGYHYKAPEDDTPTADNGDHALDCVRYIFDAELNNTRPRGFRLSGRV